MSTVVTGAIFTKVAGKSIGAIIGVVVGIITLIGLLFKTFAEIVHQDQYLAHLFFGKPAKRGMMMYPLRNRVRRVFRMAPKFTPDMEKVTEKTSGPGLRLQFPIVGRRVIIDTQDREGENRIISFYIMVKDDVRPYRLNFEAEVSLGWGLPCRNSENWIYPTTAVLNPGNFEKLCEDLMADAVRMAFSQGYRDGNLTEEDFQDSKKVFELAKERCREQLRLEYGPEFRFLRIFKVTTVPMQSGELAAAIRSTGSNSEPTANGHASPALNGALATFLTQPS